MKALGNNMHEGIHLLSVIFYIRYTSAPSHAGQLNDGGFKHRTGTLIKAGTISNSLCFGAPYFDPDAVVAPRS
jgi:hypothetical protein